MTKTGEEALDRVPAVSIIADDLTGAMDSAVQFAHLGWNARLLLDHDAHGDNEYGSANAAVTDSRASGYEEARRRTRVAASRGGESATRLFLKIDSTLRGSVRAQIDGGLDAWRQTHPGAFALVCSAYPAMGRTVVDGRLFVDGTPVQETAIGLDPVTPVKTNSVIENIPGAFAVAVPKEGIGSKESLLAAITAARERSSVISVDASEQGDLDLIAEVVAELGDEVIAVGSAGLASALAALWGAGLTKSSQEERTPQKVVVVASSLHDVTRAQVTALSKSCNGQVKVWSPNLPTVIDDDERAKWLSAVNSTGLQYPITIIDAPKQRAALAGAGGPDTTEMIAQTLADAAFALFDGQSTVALMLLGGEGARAVLKRLGAWRLHIHTAVREGIPIGTIEGGIADGSTVVTKAGGFGEKTDVADIAEGLLIKNSKGIR